LVDRREMSENRDRVWLNGERAGEHKLLDTASGKVVTTANLGREIRTTAGSGRRCGRHFVAVYVAPDRTTVMLQVDRKRFPLDGQTVVVHSSRLGGLVSRLSIDRPGSGHHVVRQHTVASAFFKRVDPGYDDLDASLDDYLADIADIANSERRLASIRELKDPAAGPWDTKPTGG
jgi:hypothetical protein